MVTFGILFYQSCTHDPVLMDMMEDEKPNSQDGDTMIMDQDTTTSSGDSLNMNGLDPCSEDSVFFTAQILPILTSNCALSGCHNAASAQDGVNLTTYSSVISTADVVPFDLNESDLYEVLVEDNEDKRMPPSPATRLNEEQINLIATWILQGAKDLSCDSKGDCNIEDVTYSNFVKPVIDNTCVGCHSGSSPSGGVNLSNYNNVKVYVDNGRFFGAINWESGYSSMPQGGSKLDDCTLDKIKKWIDDGAPNN